jgi:hypothetical protein
LGKREGQAGNQKIGKNQQLREVGRQLDNPYVKNVVKPGTGKVAGSVALQELRKGRTKHIL